MLKELCPSGYDFINVPCPGRKGGSVGLLCSSAYNIKRTSLQRPLKHLEYLRVMVTTVNRTVHPLIIYRPPGSGRNDVNFSGFSGEFEELLGEALFLPGTLLVAGDFNVHRNKRGDREAYRLASVMESMGLRQHVTDPTCEQDHVLDLLLIPADDTDTLLRNVTVHSSCLYCRTITLCAASSVFMQTHRNLNIKRSASTAIWTGPHLQVRYRNSWWRVLMQIRILQL